MERGHFDDAEQHCKALLDRGAAQAKERAKALLCAPPPHLLLLRLCTGQCFHWVRFDHVLFWGRRDIHSRDDVEHSMSLSRHM